MKPHRALEHLLSDLQVLPSSVEGGHLTDDDVLLYAESPKNQEAFDMHLRTCGTCVARVDSILTLADTWAKADGAARLARLSADLTSRVVQRQAHAYGLLVKFESFFDGVSAPAAMPAAAAAPICLRSVDDFVDVVIEDAPTGDLRLRISSRLVDLEGTSIRVMPFNQVMWLERVTPSEIGAEITIPRTVRAGLSPNTVLRLHVG